MTNNTSLKDQCKAINWPLQTIHAIKKCSRNWTDGENNELSPEQLVVRSLSAQNRQACWFEGMGINILMRAAALDVLTKRSIFKGSQFSNREDAIRASFDAQLIRLKNHVPEILTSMKNIEHKKLKNNIAEICADPIVQYSYKMNYKNNVELKDFVTSISSLIEPDFIVNVANIFKNNPYDYGSGWPDLTVIENNGISFIEVKTTDTLKDSQLRFAREIAKPLNLTCQVIQVRPQKSNN